MRKQTKLSLIRKTMTTREASEVYGMSLKTMQVKIIKGEIISTKIGKMHYIPVAFLDRYFLGNE